MTAKAVHVVELNKIGILPYEVKDPGPGEVMFKTKACGLCCWDSWLYRGVCTPGPMPFPIGHEGVGVIEKVGEGVTEFKAGDKVFCASGSNEMMCEYVTVTKDCVVKRTKPNIIDHSTTAHKPTAVALFAESLTVFLSCKPIITIIPLSKIFAQACLRAIASSSYEA